MGLRNRWGFGPHIATAALLLVACGRSAECQGKSGFHVVRTIVPNSFVILQLERQ